jgi:hypothetical protein
MICFVFVCEILVGLFDRRGCDKELKVAGSLEILKTVFRYEWPITSKAVPYVRHISVRYTEHIIKPDGE